MTSRRDRSCARCGVRVWSEAVLCRDCRDADPVYVRMTKPRPPRVRARINTATNPS